MNTSPWVKSSAVVRSLVIITGCSGSPAHAADSDSLVSRFAESGLILGDRNNDCKITNIDIGITLYGIVGSWSYGDLDGDGVLTAEDTIKAIKAVLDAGFGDVNGDVLIDDRDLKQVIDDAAGNASGRFSDANGDGVVDLRDVVLILNRQGQIAAERTSWLARDVYRVVSAVGEFGPDAFTAVGCGEEDDEFASGHMSAISQSYPGEHDALTSWDWPDNHLYFTTAGWRSHHAYTTSSSNWPNNHLQQVSVGWDHPSETDLEHRVPESAVWPPWPREHDGGHSALWHDHPNHSILMSRTWPSSPAIHDVWVTRSWPSDHYGLSSSRSDPTDHRFQVSSTYPSGHNPGVSAQWPPNHYQPMSPQWSPQHSGAISCYWPPNHIGPASATWPGGPPSWPANHFAAISNQWNQPSRPVPVFPPDHAWVPSARDLIPPISIPPS